jgi:ribonucleotide reductase beta subunit family protein with ferritin-like domain
MPQIVIELHEDDVDEPLFQETEDCVDQYNLSIQDPLWLHFKVMQGAYWTAEEFEPHLSKDLRDMAKCTPKEQRLMKETIAFFNGADLIVIANLVRWVLFMIRDTPATCAYIIQSFMEVIHSEMYRTLLDNFAPTLMEREELKSRISSNTPTGKKMKLAIEQLGRNCRFVERLYVWALVEGVFFSSSFLTLFWFKVIKKLFPAACGSNEKIASDEADHVVLAALVYKKCKNRIDPDWARKITMEFVQYEKEFALGNFGEDGVRSLKIDQVYSHIENQADIVCGFFDLAPIYNAPPISWMQEYGLQGKTNFFEKPVGEYTIIMGEESGSDCSSCSDI